MYNQNSALQGRESQLHARLGLILIILFSLFGSLVLVGCEICIAGGSNACSQNSGSNPSGSSSNTPLSGTIGGNTVGTANCFGYEKTDPEVPDQGKTVTFNVTVPNGCDVIVQGVAGQNVGSYNWNNGAVAALGPGSYSFTIQDGSYQMASDANAHAAFCNAINWIQTNGKALSQTYPLSGWGSC